MEEPSAQSIRCSIFQSEEEVIEKLTREINEAKNVEKKAIKAQELIDEMDALLSCEEYDDKNIDCKNCHTISNLRKETAQLVVKAGKLPHR